MNRFTKLVSAGLLLIVLTIGLAGCYGNFPLTRKVYDFNSNFGDKWMNELMFLVLNFVPVYEVAAFADAVIFNTIEFWTGSNPMAMNSGEEIIKYAHQDGKDLMITIRQNQVLVEDLNQPGSLYELSYKPFEKSWYYSDENTTIKLAKIDGDTADFYLPNGKVYELSNIK